MEFNVLILNMYKKGITMYMQKRIFFYLLIIFTAPSLMAMEPATPTHIPVAMHNLPQGVLAYMHSLRRIERPLLDTPEALAGSIMNLLQGFSINQQDVPWRRIVTH
jgi:hypothetical protein